MWPMVLFLLAASLATFGPSQGVTLRVRSTKRSLKPKKGRSRDPKVEHLANQGDSEAQYELAMAYRYGWGIAQNNRDAALWFREAADFGHARAQFELGLMYEFGEGVPTNLKRAHALYQKAAKQDVREARVSLALIRGKMLKVEEYIRNHHKPNYNTQEQQ